MKIFVGLLIVIAFFLRFYLIPQNLFFGPEQGRDFLVIRDIAIEHKPTLIGSKTDIDGVFHGPFYYYIALLPFAIGSGNPIVISGFFIFLSSITVFLLYMLGKEMFSKRVGILAAALFAFSFEAIVFSRWLSNPPLSIPLVTLFFLLLYRFLKGEKNILIAAAFVFGLLVQVELINLLFFGVILGIVIIFFRKKFLVLNPLYLLLTAVVLVAFSIGSFILFDFRHDFLIAKSIAGLFTKKSGYYIPFLQSLQEAFSVFVSEFAKTVLPFLISIAWFVVFGGIIYLWRVSKKTTGAFLLMLWLVVPAITLAILRHHVLEQLYVALVPAWILLAAVLIDSIWRKMPKVALMIFISVIALHVAAYIENIPKNTRIFFQSTQPELRFIDQKKAIEEVYKEAQGEVFAIQAYTIPYWKQEAWEYLFWYYGSSRKQFIPTQTKNEDLLFVIIQKDFSNAGYQNEWLRDTVSKWGELKKTSTFGILEVRKLLVKT